MAFKKILRNKFIALPILCASLVSGSVFPMHKTINHYSQKNISNNDIKDKNIIINKVLVFGDSLSDNGEDYAKTYPLRFLFKHIPAISSYFPTGVIPSADGEPYAQGRFSDGHVWAEDLAYMFGIVSTGHDQIKANGDFQDYAYGGAWSHAYKVMHSTFPLPLFSQVAAYNIHRTGSNDGHVLALIWAGANDYLENEQDPDVAVKAVVTSIKKSINSLYDTGIRHFVVMSIPNLGIIPLAGVRGPAAAKKLTDLSASNNAELSSMIKNISSSTEYKNIDVQYFDTGAVFSDNADSLLEKYKSYHFKSKNDCYPMYPQPTTFSSKGEGAKSAANSGPNYPIYHASVCADKTSKSVEHVFFDQVHPTRMVHCMLSVMLCSQLSKANYTYDKGKKLYCGMEKTDHVKDITEQQAADICWRDEKRRSDQIDT